MSNESFPSKILSLIDGGEVATSQIFSSASAVSVRAQADLHDFA
jgi:hypothetical protein